MTVNGDYVLGTHDAEVVRLGVQHRAWRDIVLETWRRAGVEQGSRVIDVGAGPGHATWDLAEVVGPSGQVLAVERADRFTTVLARERSRRGFRQVQMLEVDLMDSSPPPGYDFAWCRWVASFTPSVERLVRWIHGALRTGGQAIFHEYLDYASWRFAPSRPHLTAFVAEVMASWRAAGGEPDVAPQLVAELRTRGFRLRSARPLIFATQPGQPAWRWPAGFVATNVLRLQELGRVDRAWGEAVLRQLEEAEADPAAIMTTPMVLEIIAERG